jgi:threonine dehydratase
MPVTFQQIEEAVKRIAGHVIQSPCPLSVPLSEATGLRILCKLEYLQRTGSFKERGGFIVAESSNHPS